MSNKAVARALKHLLKVSLLAGSPDGEAYTHPYNVRVLRNGDMVVRVDGKAVKFRICVEYADGNIGP